MSSFSFQFSRKKQTLKGILFGKKYCIMIRSEFKSLSQRNDGGKSPNVF